MISTLSGLIDEASHAAPDAPCLTEDDLFMTYGELAARSRAIGAALRAKGVRVGDRVALMPYRAESWVAGWFGIVRLGAIAVPLDPGDADDALLFKLRDSGASLAVGDETTLARLQKFDGFDVVNAGADLPSGIDVPNSVTGEAPAAILYTTGTTGHPLGVLLSHQGLLGNCCAVKNRLGLTSADRTLTPLPFHYIYGLSVLLSHIAAGASLIVERGFLYPQEVVHRMEYLKATGFSGVSFHFRALIERTDLLKRALPCLRYWAHAGDRMPEELTRRILDAFPSKRIFLMYGQTEASPRLTCLDPLKTAIKPASVGAPIEGVEICVDQEGEILVKGNGVMLGYWGDPRRTEDAIRGGWLRTGDIGYMDAEGDLFLTGRRKRFLKIGGQTVHPEEIERVIEELPGVRACAVVGMPDRGLGERPVVMVETASLRSETILEHCRARLARFKIPAQITVVETLPRTVAGKTDWEEIRRLLQRETAGSPKEKI